MEKSYIRPSEKVAGIKTMGVQAYGALLDYAPLQEELIEGLARAKRHTDVNRFTDNRSNCPQAATEFVNFLVNSNYQLSQNDILLKTAYLQVLFADQKMFDGMQDLSVEQIANHFNTDINNVMCKQALDNKIKELQFQSAKPFTYNK